MKSQAQSWIHNTTDEDVEKFDKVLESLENNKQIDGLSDYKINIISLKIRTQVDEKPMKIVEMLGEKYKKTT